MVIFSATAFILHGGCVSATAFIVHGDMVVTGGCAGTLPGESSSVVWNLCIAR